MRRLDAMTISRPFRLIPLIAALLTLLTGSVHAAEYWYPSQASFATWAFEDNWPELGDYDLNDLVVDYRIHVIGDGGVPELAMAFDLEIVAKARGASLASGFGVVLPIQPAGCTANVGLSPRRDGCPYQTVSPEASSDMSRSTFVFFEDASAVLPTPEGCAFANTDDACPTIVPSERFVLHLDIAAGHRPTVSQLLTEVNPFVFRSASSGSRIEIHLPGNAPSAMAALAPFGTFDDATVLADGVPVSHTYQTVNDLPWALDVAASFTWPREKRSVIDAYPQFADWVESGGAAHADWFLPAHGILALIVDRLPPPTTQDCPEPTGPINECIPNGGLGDCGQQCTDMADGYACGCLEGFVLDEDGRTCLFVATGITDPLLLRAVSFYPLDDDVDDSLDRNPMTNYGVTFVDEGLHGGSCAYFNGAAYASTPLSGAVGLPMGRLPRTMNMWIKGFGMPPSLQTIFAYGSNASSTWLCAVTLGWGNKQIFFWGNSYNLQDPTPLDDSRWNMVTMTFDGTWMKIFINGTLTSSADRSGLNTTGDALSMGRNVLAGTYGVYLGYAQDFGLWDFALSDAEITHLFNNGNGVR